MKGLAMVLSPSLLKQEAEQLFTLQIASKGLTIHDLV